MHFSTKNILKNNYNNVPKQINRVFELYVLDLKWDTWKLYIYIYKSIYQACFFKKNKQGIRRNYVFIRKSKWLHQILLNLFNKKNRELIIEWFFNGGSMFWFEKSIKTIDWLLTTDLLTSETILWRSWWICNYSLEGTFIKLYDSVII